MNDRNEDATAIDWVRGALKTRRMVLGGGMGALGLAVGSGFEEASGGKRARRRRRRRNHGGSNGLGDGCLVCPSPGKCPYSAIQDAIDDTRGEGALITVCPGTYQERIRLNSGVQGTNVTIQGAGSTQTIIDADGEGTAVTVFPATFAFLESITVTGGKAGLGGGIVNRGSLTLKDCTITKNDNGAADNGGGGGIYNAHGAQLAISESTISDNTALDGDGGGILNAGAVALQENSRVFKNMADRGGGIFNQAGGTVTLDSTSSVSSNEPDNCVGTPAC